MRRARWLAGGAPGQQPPGPLEMLEFTWARMSVDRITASWKVRNPSYERIEGIQAVARFLNDQGQIVSTESDPHIASTGNILMPLIALDLHDLLTTYNK